MSKVKEGLEEIHVGNTIFVVDENRKIVEVRRPNEKWVWRNGVRVRPGKGSMRDVKLPPPLKLKRSSLDYLLDDRNARDIVDDVIDNLRKS